jgi:hypothetical protein
MQMVTSDRSLSSIDRPFLVMSIFVYVVSLFFEAVKGWPGWSAVLLGWLPLLSFCPGNFTWTANPLILAAWLCIFFGSRPLALVLSIASLAVSASFLLCDRVINNEGGVPAPIGNRSLGYWLWLISMILAAVSAIFVRRKNLPNQSTDPTLPSGTSAAGQPPRLP